MKGAMRIAALGAVAAATITTAATFIAQNSAAEEPIMLAHGSDHLPNQTASEWVTYADHVVAVTVTAEKENDPGRAAAERGEGLIPRDVTLTVDKVLWSRAEGDKPAPQSFSYSAFGWHFTDADMSNKVKMAGHDAPRLEVSHRYIMAIVWEEARCSPGDAPVPAKWRGLGVDSTIPFDNKVIGEGELEGRSRSASEAREEAHRDSPNFSLEDKMTGQTSEALIAELKAAKPGEKKQFGPPPSATACS
ncbi:hypothetical protein [Streptomyces sp. VNUA24]|uniref:hypothetical protein n=1 Tax=Streptomyces sp. VNUA24 TaxID=3031131 RepID=UPI0023B849F4|nr:hypothetical protein [Streptomyces sp. VNUA24]WEH16341.1 hypothetical protein PYR72_22535 [Streptomyces sp. VNUA24]